MSTRNDYWRSAVADCRFERASRPKIITDALIPRVVGKSTPCHPVLVRHRRSPAEKCFRICSNRVAQPLAIALDDFADLVRDDCWRRRCVECGLEHVSEPAHLRICSVGIDVLNLSRHRCIDDARLNDGHADVERLDFLCERFAQRLERGFRCGVPQRAVQPAIRPAIDVMLMMQPRRCCRMCGSHAGISRSAPK